jgi:hypothetical protein
MGFLVMVLLVAVVAGGLVFRRSWKRERVDRLRDQARLKVIEAQMAGLRAGLRVNVAEHATRRRMHDLHDRDLFANSTLYEEPEAWRR